MVQQLINQKLSGVPVSALRELARQVGVNHRGSHGEIAARLLNQPPAVIDQFIRQKYLEKIIERQRNVISDQNLLTELNRVEAIEWGVVQGQLDGKIQREYTREFARYDDLIRNVQNQLHREITNYVVASWYNHWSTVLIEDHISQHTNVVPTIKNIRGVDIFFRDYPFDLKITYLPRNYDLDDAIENPTNLARWLYENQGTQRFGNENRFYVVVVDTNNIEESWRLKRNFGLLVHRIDEFLNENEVGEADRLPFVFNGQAHVPICKILLVTQD